MFNFKEKNCIYCGVLFKPTSLKQLVCRNEQCLVKLRRSTERKRYKKIKEVFGKKCVVCGKCFVTSDSRKIYDSKECAEKGKKSKSKIKYSDIKGYFEHFGYVLLSKNYVNAHTKMEYICPEGHLGSSTWTNFRAGSRCSECACSRKLTIEYVRKCFELDGYILLSTEYINNSSKLDYICSEGHKHSITWTDFNAGYRCPYCCGNARKTLEEISEEFAKEGYTLLSKEYKNNKQKLEYICPNGHTGSISCTSFQQGCRCLECSGKKKLEIDFIRKEFESRGYNLLSLDYENARTPIEFVCPNGHNGKMTWDSFYNKKCDCVSCFSSSSKAEKEIYGFVCSIVGEENVKSNIRDVIPPYELDIFVPTKNLAIEYCGLYWHSEIAGGKKRSYHYDKMKACNDKGIRLITIFEDEYLNRPSSVKSRIQNAIGVGLKKIYARKCEVKEVSVKESNDFLEKCHLQGKTGSRIRLGLYYEGELCQIISVGTMSRTHTGLLKGSPGTKLLELKRFASLPGVSVVGGVSKLFKRVVQYARDNGFTHIKSYCDMRYASIVPVYEKLGFFLLTFTRYTPHYTKSGKRFRNQGLRKLPEERNLGKTEWELRAAQGFDRIWDTGHRTYLCAV